MTQLDLTTLSVREVNAALHQASQDTFHLLNPGGAHALACGVGAEISVTVEGHAG